MGRAARFGYYDQDDVRILRAAGLIAPGDYSVWFKTPIGEVGEGAGLVEFAPDGQLRGGDSGGRASRRVRSR